MQEPKTKTKSILGKFVGFVKHPFIKKNKPLLHTIEWVFVLLAFFAVGLSVMYFQVSANFLGGWWQNFANEQAARRIPEAEKKFIGETITEPVVDITGWDTYKNQWYGFEIKHPDKWTTMQYKTNTAKSARYETIYRFRKDSSGQNDPFVGFDVAVYSTKKAGSPEVTNDMKKLENAPEDTNSCQPSKDTALGEENNVFKKISVKQGDACYESAYFFSITKGDYLYDIIPIAKEGADTPADIEKNANKNFPEYKEVVASLKFIPISQPAPKPAITSPHPVAGTVVDGRIVCSDKHDHPSYSHKGKGKHMDEDCCPDPDEYPNPWCSYPATAFSILLSPSSAGKS